jgi:hypothetical protein
VLDRSSCWDTLNARSKYPVWTVITGDMQMNTRILKVLFLVSFALCAGCQNKIGGPEGGTYNDIEVVSSRQQVLSEVKATPTKFSLGIPESTYGWERTQLFFKEHTSRSNFSAGRGSIIILANSKELDPVAYRVEKKNVTLGVEFVVSCMSGNRSISVENLDLACRNLSRFIREGRLEVSLIPTTEKP